MRQCLDEGMLQSYFDGELSASLMQSASAHIASCLTCAAAARELEEENALLSEAFALEFEESVPTERLRRRIDASVAGLQIVRPAVHQPSALSHFFLSLSSLFTFSPQRVLGYAALMVILAFGVIFGLAKLRSSSTPPPSEWARQPKGTIPQPEQVTPKEDQKLAVNDSQQQSVEPEKVVPVHYRRNRRSVTSRPAAPGIAKSTPVRLLPGERAYLQTIARLDSAIKQGQKDMRPALQVEYQRNLAFVDRAIAATRNAAKKNPSDPDAADFMFAAYQSKVDLLNTIADARVYNRSH